MYQFARYGTLLRSNGLEVWIGGTQIAGHKFVVWWWPINWIAAIVCLVRLIYRSMCEGRGH